MRTVRFLISILLVLSMLLGICACGSNKKSSTASRCPSCLAECNANDLFCAKCGKKLAQSIFCTVCGSENTAGALFCSKCGKNLTKQNGNTQNGNNGGTNGNGNNFLEPDPAENVWLKVKRSSSNGYSYSIFQYDYNGYLTAETNYLSSTNTIQGASEYVRDEYGNVTSHSFSSPGKTVNETYQYEYDENGNILKEYYRYQTTGPSSKGESERTYTYDDNGLLIETVTPSSKVVCQYDDAGKLSIKKAYRTNGDAIQETEYTYSENGLLSQEKTTHFGDESNYTNIIIKNYLYSASNASTEVVTSTDDKNRIRTSTYTYICDKYGNIIRDLYDTYEYMSLAEYRKQGLFNNSDGPVCDCGTMGYSKCQGHVCSDCEGDGKLTCAGCHGTGKTFEFNGSDACRVCYGLGWTICPTCDGAGKWFY